MRLWVKGKGAFITRMGAVRNYSTNTIPNGKKNKTWAAIKDRELSGILKK